MMRNSLTRICLMVVLGLVARSALLISQQSDGGRVPSAPTVTFTLDFPESNPAHYSISVEATGHASYECRGTIAMDSEEQTYRTEFEVSARSRRNIFDWAKKNANDLFEGYFDFYLYAMRPDFNYVYIGDTTENTTTTDRGVTSVAATVTIGSEHPEPFDGVPLAARTIANAPAPTAAAGDGLSPAPRPAGTTAAS